MKGKISEDDIRRFVPDFSGGGFHYAGKEFQREVPSLDRALVALSLLVFGKYHKGEYGELTRDSVKKESDGKIRPVIITAFPLYERAKKTLLGLDVVYSIWLEAMYGGKDNAWIVVEDDSIEGVLARGGMGGYSFL